MSDHRGRPMSTFFFDMFSTSSASSSFPKKVIGPDASEKVLGRPRRSGRASWGIRGGSRRPLGRSWGSPEWSGGRLGRVLGGLRAILERLVEQFNFGSIF